MKVFRLRRMTLLGLGFLLGSRAGRGPWDKAVATWSTVQAKAGTGLRQSGVKDKIEQAKGKLPLARRNGAGGHTTDFSATAQPLTGP